MKGYIICMLLLAVTQFLGMSTSIEPVTTVVGVASVTMAFIGMVYIPAKCRFFECCTEGWIQKQIPSLKAELNAHIHGQHLVMETVPATLRGHLTHSPKKALVLSFQGTTGTGKNFVAKLVAENLYKEGEKSQFVHTLSATKHFSRHEMLDDYKDQLRGWIIGNVSACENQLFIFDEVEKMPPGLLDTLKPFVDHYESLEGVDYRKVIYIFLSNAGGNIISEYSNAVYHTGKPRETITLPDLEQSAWTKAFHVKGGLKGSTLIESSLIDIFVPFLPLEKIHVRECIKDCLSSKNFTLTSRDAQRFTQVVEEVMSHLKFVPADNPIYSQSGCKKIDQYVNVVLEKIKED